MMLGFSLSNVNHARTGIFKEPLPQTIKTGVSVRPCAGVLLSVEIDKETRFPAELKAGCELRLIPALDVRFGCGRDPSRFAVGMGVHLSLLTIDYAFAYHPVLGGTHQASVSFRLRPKKNTPTFLFE